MGSCLRCQEAAARSGEPTPPGVSPDLFSGDSHRFYLTLSPHRLP